MKSTVVRIAINILYYFLYLVAAPLTSRLHSRYILIELLIILVVCVLRVSEGLTREINHSPADITTYKDRVVDLEGVRAY